MLEGKVARYDYGFEKRCVEARNYEALEMYVMELLMTADRRRIPLTIKAKRL